MHNALTNTQVQVWSETETDTCLDLGLVRPDGGNVGFVIEAPKLSNEKLGMQYFANGLSGVLNVKMPGAPKQPVFHSSVVVDHIVPSALFCGSYPTSVEVKPMLHGGELVSSVVTWFIASHAGTASPSSSTELEADVFLAEIDGIEAITKNKDALRKLYNAFDDRADAGDFSVTDATLARLDPRRLRPELSVGVLTITLPWRKQLPARANFARSVREHFVSTLGPERAAKILRGLE